jgi:nucleotide-binding universal stress UspA family protein/predicted transcriptional regulator
MTNATSHDQIATSESATAMEHPGASRWTRTVVVALPPPSLDPQHVAEAALPYARTVAERTGASVTLVSVLDLAPKFNPLTGFLGSPTATVDAALFTETQAYLSRLADTFPASVVETVVRVGSAPGEILAVVNGCEHPLLVLSSHTRAGLDRLLFGSVTLDLVRTAPCPVLIVRGPRSAASPEGATFAKVVVPLDQSPLAEHALGAALDALGPADLHLHVLHVVEPLPRTDISPAETVALVAPKVERYLTEIAAPLLSRGYRVTPEVRYGYPAAEITQVAAEQGADLILMATHGRGGFHRILLGSVAESLLETAPAPLLLVRPADTGSVAHDGEAEGQGAAQRRASGPSAPALWERQARELMVQPVVVAQAATPLQDVAGAMVHHRIGCVPVVGEDGQVIGMVTESDFLRADPSIPLAAYQVPQLFREHASPAAIEAVYRAGRELTAGQIMSRPVTTVTEDARLGAVAERLLERRINQVPVVRDGMLIGIVSRHDLLQLLFPPGDPRRGEAPSGR